MEKHMMRVGIDKLNLKSQLNSREGSDLLTGARHEFVHLADYWPWKLVNGTWKGALGHLMNDNCMDWKMCTCVLWQLMFREMVLNSIWFRKLENNKNFQCK
jgi:hypothetical protein